MFSLEPILNGFTVYWILVMLLAIIGFVALTCYIINIFKKNTSIKEYILDTRKVAYINIAICVVGIIISYIYVSPLIKFWIFIFFIECINYIQNLKRGKIGK